MITTLLLALAIPSLRGAQGAKAPDSKPPFVIVAAGHVDVVLEGELDDVRVENDEGAADELGRIEEAAEDENGVLLGSCGVVEAAEDEIGGSLDVKADELLG